MPRPRHRRNRCAELERRHMDDGLESMPRRRCQPVRFLNMRNGSLSTWTVTAGECARYRFVRGMKLPTRDHRRLRIMTNRQGCTGLRRGCRIRQFNSMNDEFIRPVFLLNHSSGRMTPCGKFSNVTQTARSCCVGVRGASIALNNRGIRKYALDACGVSSLHRLHRHSNVGA